MEATGAALVEHWSWAAKKGLMNSTTARLMRNACLQVLKPLEGWKELDVKELDPDDVFKRFRNLEGKRLKPRSLQDYRRRFALALESYRAYVENPENWKGPGEERPTRPESNGGSPSRTVSKKNEPARAATSAPGLIEYPFPLRDITAWLTLPRDLKIAEAKRLTSFIMSLAVDSEAP